MYWRKSYGTACKKYWGNFIGGSDDSLNLVAFLVDQKKEEIPLSESFAKIGLDKQNWDFHQTVEYLSLIHIYNISAGSIEKVLAHIDVILSAAMEDWNNTTNHAALRCPPMILSLIHI